LIGGVQLAGAVHISSIFESFQHSDTLPL
jgi:hypothetical protein